jgi:hypothetical protein
MSPAIGASESAIDWLRGYAVSGLDEAHIPTLTTRAPVTWKTLDGATRELTFFSGSFGFGVTHAGEIMPVREWVIAEARAPASDSGLVVQCFSHKATRKRLR